MTQTRAARMSGRMPQRQSTRTTFLILLTGFCLAWVAAPCAAASPPVQLAQSAGDLLKLGKEALGLTETTPEGSEQTGITNGVPFLIRFRETVGSLEAGAPVLVRGMQMGAVREVKITYDAATASFNIPVVIELDPAPFTAGEPTGEAAKRVYGVIDAMVRNGLRAEIVGANLLMGSLAVALEVQPEAPPAELRQGHGGPPEIPTVSSPFQPLSARVERVAARISALPLEQTVRELEGLIAAARRIVEDPAVPRFLANVASASDALVPAARQLDPTLRAATALTDQAGESLAEVQELLSQSRALPVQIEKAAGGAQRCGALAAAACGDAGAATGGDTSGQGRLTSATSSIAARRCCGARLRRDAGGRLRRRCR